MDALDSILGELSKHLTDWLWRLFRHILQCCPVTREILTKLGGGVSLFLIQTFFVFVFLCDVTNIILSLYMLL